MTSFDGQIKARLFHSLPGRPPSAIASPPINLHGRYREARSTLPPVQYSTPVLRDTHREALACISPAGPYAEASQWPALMAGWLVGNARGMVEIGYTLLCEQTPARQLVDDAARAERAGFDYAVISDHYFPWLEEQGHSPYAWSVLGAIAHATEQLPLMTFVTCPIMRYHPAVVAQKAGTMGALSGGRFTLGLGAGENLNEHVTGEGWPPVDTQHRMFDEALEIITMLLEGEYLTYHGEYFEVDSAKLYDLPDQKVPIGVAASGPQSIELAAEYGDCLITNEPRGDVVDQFKAAGGENRPVHGQLPLAYDQDAEAAKERAHRLFRWAVGGWKVMAELPGPVNFAAHTEYVRPDDVAQNVPCGSDVDAVVEGVRSAANAGFTHVALVQVGGDQQGPFFDWAEKELLPELRRL